MSNDDDLELVGIEDPDRGESIEPEDVGENQPKEAATDTVPEVEDSGDGDPRVLSAKLKVKAELSLEAGVANSVDGGLLKSRNYDVDYSAEKDCELVGTSTGTCGALHKPVPRSGLEDDSACQLRAEREGDTEVEEPISTATGDVCMREIF